MIEDRSIPDEREVLEDRLRWAAEALTVEFREISQADAERLVFEVAEEFLSDAKVAQFVPTFATRRARQVLRSGQARGASPTAVLDPPCADLEVIVEDDPIEVETSHVDPVDAGIAPIAPVRPPAYYATEARRLLERAKGLRANAVIPGAPAD
jgi:hypothetical protein